MGALALLSVPHLLVLAVFFFSSVFVVFLTLGVNSVSVISLTQPQTRTHSRQCSATDDRILKFIRSWLIGTLNCSTDELLYFEGH